MADETDPLLRWHEAVAGAGVDLERFVMRDHETVPMVFGRLDGKRFVFGPVKFTSSGVNVVGGAVESDIEPTVRVLFVDSKRPSGGMTSTGWLRVQLLGSIFRFHTTGNGQTPSFFRLISDARRVLRGDSYRAGHDTETLAAALYTQWGAAGLATRGPWFDVAPEPWRQ